MRSASFSMMRYLAELLLTSECVPGSELLIPFKFIFYLQIKQLGVTCPHDKYSENDLPKIVVRTINHGSNVVSLDFHPQQQTIILGTMQFHLPDFCSLVS